MQLSSHRHRGTSRQGNVWVQVADILHLGCKTASRVSLAVSHIFCATASDGGSAVSDARCPPRSWSPRRRTPPGEQSQCIPWDNDHPRSSGRSQAIFTTCIATSGCKDRLASAPTILKPFQATLEKPRGPLTYVLLCHANQASDFHQEETICHPQNHTASPSQASASSYSEANVPVHAVPPSQNHTQRSLSASLEPPCS